MPTDETHEIECIIDEEIDAMTSKHYQVEIFGIHDASLRVLGAMGRLEEPGRWFCHDLGAYQ